jgi:hypothetical protein
MAEPVRFEGPVRPHERSGAFVVLPFDPAALWGRRDVYRIGGTANGCKFRSIVELADGEWRVTLTPMWLRDAGLTGAKTITFVAHLEGPQRDELDRDFAQAVAAEPAAAAFWDNLAQFYRKAYVVWIAGTKRRPDVRAERIAETVRLLKAGVKARPKPKIAD